MVELNADEQDARPAGSVTRVSRDGALQDAFEDEIEADKLGVFVEDVSGDARVAGGAGHDTGAHLDIGLAQHSHEEHRRVATGLQEVAVNLAAKSKGMAGNLTAMLSDAGEIASDLLYLDDASHGVARGHMPRQQGERALVDAVMPFGTVIGVPQDALGGVWFGDIERRRRVLKHVFCEQA